MYVSVWQRWPDNHSRWWTSSTDKVSAFVWSSTNKSLSIRTIIAIIVTSQIFQHSKLSIFLMFTIYSSSTKVENALYPLKSAATGIFSRWGISHVRCCQTVATVEWVQGTIAYLRRWYSRNAKPWWTNQLHAARRILNGFQHAYVKDSSSVVNHGPQFRAQ